MLSDIGNALHDVGVATWSLRWPIIAALVFTALAWGIDWALERHRRVLQQLVDERRRRVDAEQRIETLQRATAALTIANAVQDSPASWINDGSHL